MLVAPANRTYQKYLCPRTESCVTCCKYVATLLVACHLGCFNFEKAWRWFLQASCHEQSWKKGGRKAESRCFGWSNVQFPDQCIRFSRSSCIKRRLESVSKPTFTVWESQWLLTSWCHYSRNAEYLLCSNRFLEDRSCKRWSWYPLAINQNQKIWYIYAADHIHSHSILATFAYLWRLPHADEWYSVWDQTQQA